jgi:hypothetical protein
MLTWKHGREFSLDATACIVANDWHELKRRMRYCDIPSSRP